MKLIEYLRKSMGCRFKFRRRPHYSKGKDPHHKDNIRRDLSKIRCYTCDERGHFAKYFPKNKGHSHKKKGNKRRHHAHATEDDEPSKKRSRYESEILQARMNMF